MIQELRADFEKLLAMVTSPEAATATLDQMERSLLRQLLRLGLKLLKLFLQSAWPRSRMRPCGKVVSAGGTIRRKSGTTFRFSVK
jgi:hypothetical protein